MFGLQCWNMEWYWCICWQGHSLSWWSQRDATRLRVERQLLYKASSQGCLELQLQPWLIDSRAVHKMFEWCISLFCILQRSEESVLIMTLLLEGVMSQLLPSLNSFISHSSDSFFSFVSFSVKCIPSMFYGQIFLVLYRLFYSSGSFCHSPSFGLLYNYFYEYSFPLCSLHLPTPYQVVSAISLNRIYL